MMPCFFNRSTSSVLFHLMTILIDCPFVTVNHYVSIGDVDKDFSLFSCH